MILTGASAYSRTIDFAAFAEIAKEVGAYFVVDISQDLPAVVDLAFEGVINYKEIVSKHFSLEQADEGYKALRDQKIQGRAIVDMSL